MNGSQLIKELQKCDLSKEIEIRIGEERIHSSLKSVHEFSDVIRLENPAAFIPSSADVEMKRLNMLRDSVYNCHPSCGRREYAKGVLLGCVSGLMATGYTFEDAIRQLREAARTTKSDLKEEDVVECLPDTWRVAWQNLA